MKGVLYDLWTSSGRKFVEDLPVPKVEPGKVLVEVRAVAINPVDYKLPKFIMRGKGVAQDFSGVVKEVGSGVENFAVGDRVFGNTSGALSELNLCNARHIAKIPEELSFVEAAAMPTTYLTGYQALMRHGFQPGQKLLIIGASGGCGTAAIQLAKEIGAGSIIGVCSKRNEGLVRDLGANEVVDYTSETILGKCGSDSVDFVYDCATGSGGGENYIDQSKKALKKPDGQYVAINGPVMSWLRKITNFQNEKFVLWLKQANGSELEKIINLMKPQEGSELKFRPIIDTVLPFSAETVEKGYGMLKSRRTAGKIVFDFSLSQ